MHKLADQRIELFSTCPPLSGSDGGAYLSRVVEVARWSDQAGCRGILIYTDNAQVDPWWVAQTIIRHTPSLCPLVAVQPIYMHPYTVAKIVASIGYLHRRRVYLNMVAGGFKNDLLALNDTTPHDERYDRLAEYTLIIKQLLAGDGPVSFDGRYYKINGVKLAPPLAAELFPEIFISGSSDAGLAAATALGATAIKYPKPTDESRNDRPGPDASGIRIGILTRPRNELAWEVALARFPEDRKGELTRQFATKVSDSIWHKQLSELPPPANRGSYWLAPFERYQTNCPYLVGDYGRVGRELSKYIALGHRTFILDVPPDAEELAHTRKAFDCALEDSRAANA